MKKQTLKREFLINIAFLILINFLVKPLYILFIESRVQDTLGPNEYGLYFGIFNFAMMLQILADLGIQNFNSTAVSRDNSLLQFYLPKMLGLKASLSLIYLLVGLHRGFADRLFNRIHHTIYLGEYQFCFNVFYFISTDEYFLPPGITVWTV